MTILSFKIKTLHGMSLPIQEVESDVTIKELVNDTVNHMEYPLFDDRQKEIEYYLENSKGVRLSPEDTLAQAGVQKDEVLMLKSSANVADPGKRTSAPVAPAAGMVNVYVQLMDLNRTELESFDMNRRVGDALNEIIKKYKLPARDEKLKEGKLYELFSKTVGAVLHEGMTLREAKIPNLDTFIVSTNEIPG